MIHRRRLAAALLSFSLMFTAVCPAFPAFGAAWQKSMNGSYIASDGSAITGVLSRGIDVSHWKQSINWNAVAADDVQFVMLGTRYNNDVDPYFSTNAIGAYNAGLKVGAYIYSYATTTAAAEAEADFVLNLIKDYPISYPVVIDVESTEMSSLTPTQLASVINAFCKKIETAGYYPMLYTNDYWIANKIDMNKVPYDVWIARYNVKPAYSNAALWQATNEGQVNGISGNVDINFAFKDLSQKIPANRWRLINDKWYYYKNYIMQTGWIHDGQSWYYMNSDGTQYKGWLLLDNDYYYLLPTTGQMQTGWVKIEDTWYYLKADGRMANEWIQVDGKYYYMLNGAMVTGWLRIGTDYYYLKGDGSMVTGWRKMDGAYYFFNTDGRLIRGWANIDGKYYYMKSDGTMVTGWQTIDNAAYYFNPDGDLATQWTKIDNNWYYFNTDGRMMTGWIQLNGKYYYLHTDGRMVTGWQSDGTNKYYMDPSSGQMAVGWKQINNVWYYFNTSGHMLTGWLNDNGKYYYLNPSDGKMVANGSFTINNVNYTFDKSGACLNEASAIDGGSAGSVYSTPTETMGNQTSVNMGMAPGSSSTGQTAAAPGNASSWNTAPGNTGMQAGNNGMSAGNTNISTPGGNSVTVTSPGNTSSVNSQFTNGSTAGPGGTTSQNSYPSSAPGSTSQNTSSATWPGGTTSGNTSGTTSGGASAPGTPSSDSGSGLKSYQTGGPK